MAASFDFYLPEYQNATVQVALAPPTSISGWSLQFDLCYSLSSTTPIVSKYLSSGYTAGQSGITLVNGQVGVFNVAFTQLEVSGISLNTTVLAHRTKRVDSGNVTPLVAGYRLLSQY